ncbi:MAG: DUF5132 domain-containing protein [Oculatellaceae cyanobacterium Prado106]|jgi:hypothetical protein|nr:DUF5132 domain-containing protein [Oculatellaceae cyanobacterium Prado106]
MKMTPKLEEIAEKLGVPGVMAIVLLPVLAPVAGKVVKPVAKAAIKHGIAFYETGKGVVTEMVESLDDIIAEAKAELAEESETTLAAAAQSLEPAPEES